MPETALPFIPFALPDIGDDEIAEVVDTLRSGWITTGPKTRRFEEDFTSYLGDPGLHSLAVNSATAGLHLALEALGIGPGDEVITTTHTFTATAEVVRYLGADVVLVDIDPATLCIDVTAVEAAITPRTKAVIPVHYAGLAADMAALLPLARRHGLKVVEDAAHALPTTCGGQLVGTLGSDVTVFSFYANKTMTTGEGGMVVTRDAAIAKRVQVMRLHGINRDAFDRFTAKAPSWYYEIVAPGFKYNLTDLAAAMGRVQLDRLEEFLHKREAVKARYFERLAHLPLILPPEAAVGDVHSWHLFVIQLAPAAKVTRDELAQALQTRNIGISLHYRPLHRMTYWAAFTHARFPAADAYFDRCLTLPLFMDMSEAEVDYVVAALTEILS